MLLKSFGYFFFSSRRRHTRCSRDWSSDVCSSDLTAAEVDRARNTFETQTIRNLQFLGGFGGVADQLNYYNHYVGTPDYLTEDRKSTRLNSSHGYISYAVFCLKKKKNKLTKRQLQS